MINSCASACTSDISPYGRADVGQGSGQCIPGSNPAPKGP